MSVDSQTIVEVKVNSSRRNSFSLQVCEDVCLNLKDPEIFVLLYLLNIDLSLERSLEDRFFNYIACTAHNEYVRLKRDLPLFKEMDVLFNALDKNSISNLRTLSLPNLPRDEKTDRVRLLLLHQVISVFFSNSYIYEVYNLARVVEVDLSFFEIIEIAAVGYFFIKNDDYRSSIDYNSYIYYLSIYSIDRDTINARIVRGEILSDGPQIADFLFNEGTIEKYSENPSSLKVLTSTFIRTLGLNNRTLVWFGFRLLDNTSLETLLNLYRYPQCSDFRMSSSNIIKLETAMTKDGLDYWEHLKAISSTSRSVLKAYGLYPEDPLYQMLLRYDLDLDLSIEIYYLLEELGLDSAASRVGYNLYPLRKASELENYFSFLIEVFLTDEPEFYILSADLGTSMWNIPFEEVLELLRLKWEDRSDVDRYLESNFQPLKGGTYYTRLSSEDPLFYSHDMITLEYIRSKGKH